jgi:hypothetical protein
VLKVSGYKIISSEEKPRSIGVKGTWKEWWDCLKVGFVRSLFFKKKKK